MNRYERLNSLLELLADRGRLDVEDVATELAVSTATIRRDFDHLAQQQLVTRTRGGAVAQQRGVRPAVEVQDRSGTQPRSSASDVPPRTLVEPGMTVGLNGGTTTTAVARALATHARPEQRQRRRRSPSSPTR